MMEGSRSGTKRDLLAQVPQVSGRWGARIRKMGVVVGGGRVTQEILWREATGKFSHTGHQRDISLL